MAYEKTILVTGGAGFIGLHVIEYFLKKYPQYFIVNLDQLTYAANLKELATFNTFPNYRFVKGNINNRPLIEELLTDLNIDSIIHLAAETHVDRSIGSPENFIETNVKGTFTLLEAVRNIWLHTRKTTNHRFHHISTDEVYGSLGPEGFFTEETPFAPNNPYSASKASADLLVRSYFHTYGLNTVTTHCSNNYGPKQHEEKLIPTIIRKALHLERIPIYGDGKHTRDWLFVLDHCNGIDLAFHRGRAGVTYNIGGKNEHTNLEIAEKICGLLDEIAPEPLRSPWLTSYKELIQFVHDRPGHDRRYAVDSEKIGKELGWKAKEPFDQGLRKTVEWYIHEHRKSP
ncbi:MAG TPA: dTDP-glucose 4,6-dehydratase [Bacillales bacterium]|nr:dTDP-glucose 4,6-dehydratase [Bacillales bacterium]